MTTTKQTAKGDGNTQISIQEFNANIGNISSILASAVPRISTLVSTGEMGANDTTAYDLEEKITYNNVQTFKEILDEYGQFGPQIDGIYDEYDNDKPGFKNSVFKYFKTKYLLKKQQLHSQSPTTDVIQVVRENADKIIRDIYEEFKADLKASNNLTLSMEEVEACALAVTCHAFIQCKILEKPKP